MKILTQYNPFVQFPALALAAAAAVCALLAVQSSRFQVRSEAESLLEGDRRNLESYQAVKDILRKETVIVVSMECPEVFSIESMDAIRRLSEDLLRQPGAVEVKSFTHAVKPVRDGMSFVMVPLVSLQPSQAELDDLKEYSLSNPLMRNVMVSSDARRALLLATYRRNLTKPESQQDFADEIRSILNPYVEEGYRFNLVGLPLIEHDIRNRVLSDILRFGEGALAVLTLILWLAFRSWPAVGLILIAEASVLVCLPGLMRSAGLEINLYSLLLFPLIAAVQLSMQIHLVHSWQRQSGSPKERVLRSLEEAGRPCFYSAVTTGAGLLALGVSDLALIQQFGLSGALCLALACFVSLGPLPAMLQLAARWSPSPAEGRPASIGVKRESFGERGGFFIRWLDRGSEKNWPAIVAAALLLGVSLGMLQLRTDVRIVEFLPPESPIRLAVEEMNQHYGGVNVVQIEVKTSVPNGIHRLSFLRYLESVQRFAQSQPEVSETYSYAQLLSMMNEIWEGGDPQAFRLPENSFKLSLFVLALKTQPLPFLAALSDENDQTAHLIVRTPDMSARPYLEVIERIVAHARENRPDGVTVSAAKGIHRVLESDRRILESQIQSAGVSIGLIALVLTLLWRSPSLALLSVFVNVIPIAAAIGFAGLADIPLNSITVLVAAVALGIAVDDSVHLITQWKAELRKGFDGAEAVKRALRVKAKPIVASSFILAGVFGLLFFSQFPPVVHFGAMSAMAFIAALISVLTLLPAMLSAGGLKCGIKCRTKNNQ